jgi:hypothetical protein
MAQNKAVISAPLSRVSMLALPKNAAPNKLAKIVSQEVLITRALGGDVRVPCTYTTTSGNKFELTMTLHFDPMTVPADTTILIKMDTETLVAEFEPSGIQFDKEATLTATVKGLNLTSVPDDASVKLFYINGTECTVMPGEPTIDKVAGSLVLTDGKIKHFSLYGFGFLK